MPRVTREHTITRVLDVIECISHGQGQLSVRTISQKLNLPKTTVHRILDILNSRGWVSQDPITGHYHIGVKILQLAGGHYRFTDLRDKAFPVMQRLQRACRETVSLYVRDGDERVCIERIEGSHEIRSAVRVGQRLPLYAGAAGKVLLAVLPESELNKFFERTEVIKITEHTLVDQDLLREQLEVIRRRGYATSFEERVPWSASVAAPIYDSRGGVVAAINITGPKPRFEGANLASYVHHVITAASEISRLNGL